MGIMDFLFEGQPPKSVTTYGSQTSNLPQWLSDYTQALLARANTAAAEPYQAFPGPRLADFSSDQRNAWDLVRNNIGGWGDAMEGAQGKVGGAMDVANPYFAAASRTTPEAISEYMDPYTGNVIDRATQLAMRNYEENVLPGLTDRFIAGGQSGSTAHMREANRASRDLTEGVQSQALAALSDAYRTAGSQFGTDASRMAGLGSDVGNLQLQTGQSMADLARQSQQMGLVDAGALEAIGGTQQDQTQRNLDLARGDFEAQRDYPKDQIDWLSSIIQGTPYDRSTSSTSTGPAAAYGPSGLSQLLSLYGVYKDIFKAKGGRVRKPSVKFYADGGLAALAY